MKKNYVPPKQGWFGQVFDSIFILALVFASLLTPLLLKSEAAASAAATAAKATWQSLNLPAIEQAQWIKLGYDPEKASALINSRFDYSVDPLWLGITILVIAGYFVFMLKVSEKEYKEVIAEKFGDK
ncbi:MAG TPA: hypothetical protein VFX01_02395 [Methylophilaceae bacterium]|nr:hypothetical protein [Methylophilaceae bacterium]